jgi:hypothetical protein
VSFKEVFFFPFVQFKTSKTFVWASCGSGMKDMSFASKHPCDLTTHKKLKARIQCWLVLGFQSGARLYLDPSVRTRPISLGHNLELDLTSLHGPRPIKKLNPMGFQGFGL